VKSPTIDLIQVFCANFDCDLDLRYPPGVVRRSRKGVVWPDLSATNLFQDSDSYDRKVQIHRLEILLRRSRYSLEVLNLLLSTQDPLPHLMQAVKTHYSCTPTSENFHPEMMVYALRALGMLPPEMDESLAISDALSKYEKWLGLATAKAAL